MNKHIDQIFDELEKFLTNKDISEKVYNQTTKVLNGLNKEHIKTLSLDNVYYSNDGFVILDWKNEKYDSFNLIIGSKSIGYFIEVNNKDIKLVEESYLTKYKLKEINDDLSDFFYPTYHNIISPEYRKNLNDFCKKISGCSLYDQFIKIVDNLYIPVEWKDTVEFTYDEVSDSIYIYLYGEFLDDYLCLILSDKSYILYKYISNGTETEVLHTSYSLTKEDFDFFNKEIENYKNEQ